MRHTYDFGADRASIGDDLVDPHAWDAARSLPGPFGLPESREAWERLADREELRARARDVVALAGELGARDLCSHGVGTATLELNVRRLAPDLPLVCTDYAPQTVERLRRLFPEATVLLRDLTDAEPPSADLHLMHRVDAELSDEDWRLVFGRVRAPILVVPNVLLDFRGAVRELARRVLRPQRLARAGWFRNEEALRALWADSHDDREVTVGGVKSFLLLPR